MKNSKLQLILTGIVGFASIVPLLHAAIILFLVLSYKTQFLDRIIISLLVTSVLVWLPAIVYLISLVTKSGAAESTKSAWIVSLIVWAPLAVPIAWYRFCVQHYRNAQDGPGP